MKAILRSILSLLPVLFLASNAKALTCYALTDNNHLIVMDSTSPGTAVDKGLISGLGSYNLVGMDIRTTTQTTGAANPGVGSVWALGTDGTFFQIFIINNPTGSPSATAIGAPLSGINGSGSGPNGWFFGFNPATDRIQMMNFTHNYQLNPNTITYVTQSNLQGFPNSNGSAFTTASFGGTSTIYFLDQAGDALYTSSDISTGNYSLVGATGISFSLPAGLDTFEGTTLMATVDVTSKLFSVNRSTGVATLIGTIAGNPTIRALTIVPTSFPPVLSATVKITGKKRVVTTKAALVVKGTAASQAGIKLVQYKVGKAGFKNAVGTTSWRARVRLKPGLNLVSVQATGGNDAKSAIAKVRIIRQ